MKATKIQKWFEELKRIWLEKDISALQTILSKDFEYYEDPNEPPITSWSQLENVWQEIKQQDIKRLEIDVLIDGDERGMAKYIFSYTDSNGETFESRGAYFVVLDEDGRAMEFRQWWNAK